MDISKLTNEDLQHEIDILRAGGAFLAINGHAETPIEMNQRFEALVAELERRRQWRRDSTPARDGIDAL